MPRSKTGRRTNSRHRPQRVQKCKECGCTNQDACFHPEHGECFWFNDVCDLCSHCAMGLDCGPRDSQIIAEMERQNG